MAADSFVSNPGASPWIVTAPGPGLVRHQNKQQKRFQLLQQASTMTPDQQELVKQLSEHELSPADANYFGTVLSEGLKDFATKYNENPFYAFSREGKESVAGLQRLVRDPKIIAASRAFKQSEEDLKKIKESHLTGLVDVKDGRISVVRRDNGQIERVLPENLDFTIHQPYSIENLYQHKIGGLGFLHKDLDKIQPFSHDMEDPDKVIDQVTKWFSGLGSTQLDEMGQVIDKKTTTNASQIASRLNAIYAKTGLSQQARNTIYAQYYTDALSRGEKPTRLGAEEALVKSLGQIAKGYDIFKQDNTASAVAQGHAAIKDAAIAVSPFEFNAANPMGAQKQMSILDNNGRSINVSYVHIPTDKPMNVSSNTYYNDDTKDTHPMRNVKDLSMFQIMDQKDLYIPDLYNAGKLVPLPDELRPFIGELVVDPTFLGGTGTKTGKNGERYVAGDTRGEGDLDRTIITKVKFQGRGGDYSSAVAALEKLGYTPGPMTSEEQKEYRQNVDNPNYSDQNLPGWLSTRDAYQFDLMGVYRDPNVFNSLYNLPDAYKSRNDNMLYSGAKQGGESDEISNNPFNKVKGAFTTFNDLNGGK